MGATNSTCSEDKREIKSRCLSSRPSFKSSRRSTKKPPDEASSTRSRFKQKKSVRIHTKKRGLHKKALRKSDSLGSFKSHETSTSSGFSSCDSCCSPYNEGLFGSQESCCDSLSSVTSSLCSYCCHHQEQQEKNQRTSSKTTSDERPHYHRPSSTQ